VLEAARDVATLARRILDSGAGRVAVLNLFDLGATPMPPSPATAATLTALTADFNAELARALPRDPRLVAVDTHGFFAALLRDRARHGYTHPPNEDACRSGAMSPACYEAADWKTADAPDSFVFIGGVHFTRRTNELLARHVLQQLGEQIR
jgi:phospholipase/lecithinase/hemolysin